MHHGYGCARLFCLKLDMELEPLPCVCRERFSVAPKSRDTKYLQFLHTYTHAFSAYVQI